MPNANQHIKIGIICGATAGGVLNSYNQYRQLQEGTLEKFDFTEVVFSALWGSLVGFFFSLLPDILEPAYNPNHRKFFHSYTFACILIYFSIKVWVSQISEASKNMLQCALLGYFSHLVADSMTPRGLRLF